MNTDEFFAEAKRLGLRMHLNVEEQRAAFSLKDAEIQRLRGEIDELRRMSADQEPTVGDSPQDACAEQNAMDKARKAAHDALNEAERAWYAYAGIIDVGQERTQAFAVYERVRQARHA